MYLSGGHKTVKNILKRGAFTVSMGDAEHAAACDYVGIESGNSVPDKVARGLPRDEERACGRAGDRRAPARARVQARELRRGDKTPDRRDRERQRGRSRSTKTAGSLSKSCTSSPLTTPTTAIMSWARRSPARSRTAKNSSKSGETESAASRIFFGTRRFFAVSVRSTTLFVQNRRISVKISLKTVPFTTGMGAGQMV